MKKFCRVYSDSLSAVDFATIPVSTIADGAYNIIVRTQNQAIWSDQIIIRK
jgi:hypothetical protein